MKNQSLWIAGSLWIAALLTATLFAAGCTDRDDYGTTTADEARYPDYPYTQREQFRRDMETTLQKLDAKIDELRAKAAAGTEEAKAEAQKMADSIESELADLRQDLAGLASSTEATWDDFKSKFRKTMDDLDRRLRDALD